MNDSCVGGQLKITIWRLGLPAWALVLVGSVTLAADGRSWQWETIDTTGQPTARHEATFVEYHGKIYLIGGRRKNPVDVYDPQAKLWTQKSATPIELHHFQAVVVNDGIYLVGAMTGPFPKENPLDQVVVYYPEQDKFEFGHTIPQSRRRGGAGAVCYNNKIYIVGGIVNGHMDGYQPWLDEYNPETGEWRVLEDAPHARDHFQAVVHGHKLYAVAGRTTSAATNQVFDLTVQPIDVYDFSVGRWLPESQALSLPTPRAGNMAATWNDEILIGGGESNRPIAHAQVEAFDINTKQWREWPRLQRGRHGSGFAIVGGYLYTASGSGNRGGSPELATIERLRLPNPTLAPSTDH